MLDKVKSTDEGSCMRGKEERKVAGRRSNEDRGSRIEG